MNDICRVNITSLSQFSNICRVTSDSRFAFSVFFQARALPFLSCPTMSGANRNDAASHTQTADAMGLAHAFAHLDFLRGLGLADQTPVIETTTTTTSSTRLVLNANQRAARRGSSTGMKGRGKNDKGAGKAENDVVFMSTTSSTNDDDADGNDRGGKRLKRKASPPTVSVKQVECKKFDKFDKPDRDDHSGPGIGRGRKTANV